MKKLITVGLLVVPLIAACHPSASGQSPKVVATQAVQPPVVPSTPAAVTLPDPVVETPEPPAEPPSGTIGDVLHVTEDDSEAAVTLKSLAIGRSGPGDIAEAPSRGYYLVAHVVIRVSSGSFSFNPLYFNWTTDAGDTYGVMDGNAFTAGFEPQLHAGEISAGQRTGGVLVFDVPRQGGDLTLSDPSGSEIGSWHARSNAK